MQAAIWTALYPFGYGLSYTSFSYSDPAVEKAEYILTGKDGEYSLDTPVKVSVTVTNTGSTAGTETVQLYVRDMTGSVARPLRELKRFEKVSLQPGESRTIEFRLTADDLAFYTQDLERIVEPGRFTVMTGGNSRDVMSAEFSVR